MKREGIRNEENTAGIMKKLRALLLFIISISGITLFDITIADLPFFEIPFFKRATPEIKERKNQGMRISSQPHAGPESAKLSLPKLRESLDGLMAEDKKLAFIETNVNLTPNRLSLAELNSILDLFLLSENKLKVTSLFRYRIDGNYSEAEFEKFKDHYLLSDDRVEAINLLIGR